jgi:hypothetical protein
MKPFHALLAAVALSSIVGVVALDAQGGQNDTPYVATRLIWRWRGIMNKTLEDSRAFASEPVTDLMEVFVSPGAVRAVQDKLNEDQLKKADAVVERFALTVVRFASRQEDGSRIVEEEAVQAAEKATCPVYPFCPE